MRQVVLSCVILFPVATEAQQINRGDCSVQIGEGASNNTVIVNCTKPGLLGLLPNFGRPDVSIEIDADGLKKGRSEFDLVVRNMTADQIVKVNSYWLSIGDDLGNVYELDNLTMQIRDIPQSSQISPGRLARFPVLLTRNVSANAKEAFFILDNVWSNDQGSAFARSLPPIEWSVSLVDQSEEQAQELQTELKRLGYYKMEIDGDWGDGSRRALKSYQSAIGEPATGAFEDGVALLQRMKGE